MNNIPKELQGFFALFYGNGQINRNVLFSNIYTESKLVTKYLESRYLELFKKKNITESRILELLYKETLKKEELADYYQACFIACKKCFLESIEYINNVSPKIKYLDEDKSEMCRSLFQELIIFLSVVEKYFNPQKEDYGFGRRNIVFSTELYYSTYYHLFNYFDQNTMAGISTKPISIFLLRQAIEVRYKNALGVYVFRNSHTHESIMVKSDIYIDFVYMHKDEIQVPISKRSVNIIKKWSNSFIHTGFMHEIYKIWYALKTIEPLFTPLNNEVDGYYRDGSIIINKKYYENKLDYDLIEYVIQKLPKNNILGSSDIYIEKISPEAYIKEC